jgi:PAS domain S-box-containing protein
MSHPHPPGSPPAPGVPASHTLRQQAEARWQAIRQKTPDIFGDLTLRDTDILMHDLHVHQIELELQNEELSRAKDALDASRARYVELYDLAPVGYCSVNEAGLISQANLTLASLLGVARKALVNRPFSALVIREDQDSWYQLRRALLDGSPPRPVELRLHQDAGTMGVTGACLWVQLTCTLAQDEAGAAVLHLAVSDMSARKLAEEALQESETRFRTLFEASQDAVLLHRDGKVIFANPTAAAMFGTRSDSELVGKAVMALVHPEDAPVIQTRIKNALEFGQIATALEGRYVKLDGTVFHAETQGRAIVLDGLPAILVTLRDIAERKLAQAKLELAASVFGHAREGITITDAQGTIVDVNEAFTRVTGYSREEAIGQNPRILKSGRQDQAFYEAMWASLISLGFWSGEIWNCRKSGEVYASLLTVSAVRDANGNTHQYVGLFSDITAIKAHQSQLEHMAHYDPLTHLPNRLLLGDRFAHAAEVARSEHRTLTLFYLDLDHFKHINDSLGYAVGDHMLLIRPK